jgi:ABC-type phosphate/phosphonate transport system substrate-binding protein
VRVSHKFLSLVLGTGMLGLAYVGTAADTEPKTTTKVAFVRERAPDATAKAPAATLIEKDTYVFSAPPGGDAESDRAIYEPIAVLLSRATGKTFVYQRADNWLSYSRQMTGDTYDVLFDGAPLNAWRQGRMNHKPLVRLSQNLTFVTVVRNDNKTITSEKHLAGKTICAHSPTDPEMAGLLSQFDNPLRQPVLVDTDSAREAFFGLINGKCAATVVSIEFLEANDRGLVNIIHKRAPLPGHALSASPRLSPAIQEKIRAALLSEAGKTATAKLREAFGGANLVDADPTAYSQLGDLLKNNVYHY